MVSFPPGRVLTIRVAELGGSVPSMCLAALPGAGAHSKSHFHGAHLAVEETAHKQVNQPTKAMHFHVVVNAVTYIRKVWKVDG